jgi:predicted nucleic acid-binding Zn ribbon protein
MPTYDYRCEANGAVVEVRHRMSEQARTWGELCALAGIDTGETPADAPVKKLITGGQVVRSSSLGDAAAPACSSGPCCGGGMCGID